MTKSSILGAKARGTQRGLLGPRWVPYLWIFPGLAVAVFVVGLPIVNNIGASFTTRSGSVTSFSMDNYGKTFADPQFYQSFWLTVVWTVVVTAMQFILGLVAAVMADRPSRYMLSLRPILILPWALPGVVAAYIWVFFYDDHGLVNQIIGLFGADSSTAWLANPSTALAAVMFAAAWKGFPFYFLLLLAGLQSVPPETREAAKIDGASAAQTIVLVVIPQMKAIIATSLILGIIQTSNYFDGIYLMTGGGPSSATETLPVWVYNVAFNQFDIPKASALSVIILVIVILLMFVRAAAERIATRQGSIK